LGILLLIQFLEACVVPAAQAIPVHPWASSLRALDPSDVPNPAYDLTAVYLRPQDTHLQIRVDLLAFKNAAELSLDITISDTTDPPAPPVLVHLPAPVDSNNIALDTRLATIVVEIPIADLPTRPRVDVITPQDSILDLHMDGMPPPQTAPLLLTFSETFSARFPAEALRSWDGAHTGPRGERHGLKHLLDAVERNRTPIVLLDLKEPESLSALDALGVLERIRTMEQEGLLILPDQPGQLAPFGFSSNPFTFGENHSRAGHAFVHLFDPGHVYKPPLGRTTYFPIAAHETGAGLEVRRALLEIALNRDEQDLLTLGGSLPESDWGSPEGSDAALAYFASRPYVRALSAGDLLAFPAQLGEVKVTTPYAAPLDDQALQAQRALAYAVTWAASAPFTQAVCREGTFPACLMANESWLAIFSPQGARLEYLFFAAHRGRALSELHQLVGPSWQVAPGINLYPGAFADTDNPYGIYTPAVMDGALVFTSPDGARVKAFNLTTAGLNAQYRAQTAVTTQIPLLVDPDSRFSPGWAEMYSRQQTPNGVRWGLMNGMMVEIQAPAPIEMRAFNEALSLLTFPEDPDASYPLGYYVPFPMAVVEIRLEDDDTLRLAGFTP